MRLSARILFVAGFLLLAFGLFKTPASAQTTEQAATVTSSFSDVDPSVPRNHHTYTQVVLIDALSAIMCQLTGVDPTNPKEPCLGVNPMTGQIGTSPSQQFGQAQNTEPQIGGALGLTAQYISALYVPVVSSTQYVNYLASNFGIVKPTYASPFGGGTNCSNSPVGYGFCGLGPIFQLWTKVRDFAYAFLTLLFIAIGVGVMLRFRVDPRTVMTLQNQVPRVIIAIALITFSYAIAGGMIDIMWTATYAGINFITTASPNSQVAVGCGPTNMKPISQAAEQTLINQPISFTDMVFNKDCKGIVHSGIFKVSESVSSSLGDLVVQVVKDLLGINVTGSCSLNPFSFSLTHCIQDFFIWLTEQIVKLIVIIAILIALFRLWFVLIKTYLTFIIFVIMGPIWIVFGLIPGRPLGFEKWLRIIFANLAAFPLVAFILVFARVMVDAIPQSPTPQNMFIPPLVGNPNLATFGTLMGFGAILLAPSIPDLIKERMKATGQGKYGATIAAGLGFAAGAGTSMGRNVWERVNRRNPQTGEAEGSVAIMKQKAWEKTPFFGRRAIGRREQFRQIRMGQRESYNRKENKTLGSKEAVREREARRNPQPPIHETVQPTQQSQGEQGNGGDTGNNGGGGTQNI